MPKKVLNSLGQYDIYASLASRFSHSLYLLYNRVLENCQPKCFKPLISMSYQDLLQKVEEQVTVFYRDHTDERMFYHNQSLTKSVMGIVKRMADHYHLDDRSFFIVNAAAGFLYTGYFITGENTELQKSAEAASAILQLIGVAENDIAAVKNSILSTANPQKPQLIEDKILCDADAYYYGTSSFRSKNKLLRKETDALAGEKIDGNAWRMATIGSLESHQYHTDYCHLLLDKTKADNLLAIQSRHEEKISKQQMAVLETQVAPIAQDYADVPEMQDIEQVVKIKKREKPIRGSEMMFRISSANNVRISVMADNKAHIMISVNSIIISVVLGLIIQKLDENRNLLVPTIILLVVNVSTIIYAILATRPRLTPGTFTQEQVTNKSVNLLFFGSFYNMEFKQYDEALQAMLTDREFLYASLTKDIFWQGKVLGRKYRYLNISYTIFMFGIIISVLAYAIAAMF